MYKKIAILRANALGDFMFVLPAITALRQRYPEVEMVLLGNEMHRRLMDGRQGLIDRVEVIPKVKGLNSDNDEENSIVLDSFFKRMHAEEFDVAIQMHGGGRYSNGFVLQLGAKLTLGSRTSNAAELDISIPYTTYVSEVLRYVEMANYLDAPVPLFDPVFPVIERDRKEAEQFIRLANYGPYVVMQPGASDFRRWWPAENFAVLADRLVERGFRVFFNGIESEAELIRRVIQGMERGEGAIDVSGALSLNGLIGLLAGSKLMVSNDTGPLHLAAAIGTPCVGIYWAPNMVTGTPMRTKNFRPLIAWDTNCSRCGASFRDQRNSNGCLHDVSFVSEISVQEVINAIAELNVVDIRNEVMVHV
jgi:ADP-heptose:LPS heptosyltransferase